MLNISLLVKKEKKITQFLKVEWKQIKVQNKSRIHENLVRDAGI